MYSRAMLPAASRALLTTLSVGALLLGSAAAQAAAVSDFKFTPSYTGKVTLKYTGMTTECSTANGDTCYGDGRTGGATNGPGGGTLNETTWGIGRLTTIQDSDGNDLWQSTPTYQVAFLLYGIADLAIAQITPIDPGNPSFNVFNVGCQGGPCDGKIHLDAYVVDSFPGFSNLPTGNRTPGAFDQFTGITDGELLFKLTADPGVTTLNPAASLWQIVTATTLPASGKGTFLASCADGPLCNSVVNGINFNNGGQGPTGASDIFGEFTLKSDLTRGQKNAGWLGSIDDPMITNSQPTPAPGGLLLLLPGLIGIGWGARRNRQRV